MECAFTDHFAQRVIERKVDIIGLMPEIERHYKAGAFRRSKANVFVKNYRITGVLSRNGTLVLVTIADRLSEQRNRRHAKNKKAQGRSRRERAIVESIATLVDARVHTDFNIYIGRGQRKAKDVRLRFDHPFTAPYYRHQGSADWREEAVAKYEAHLREKVQDRKQFERFMELKGKRLGVWGDFGAMLGEVVLKLLEEGDKYNTVRAPEAGSGAQTA